jgi:NADH dehydrogenase FAD-containing subunit
MKARVKENLSAKNIAIYAGKPVTKVADMSVNGYHTVWTAGIKPPPLIASLNQGRPLQTDDTLKFKGSIYALGDIVTGKGPATAQNAKQQGEYLAKYFNSKFKDQTSYKYQEKGRILDLTDTILVEKNGIVFELPPLFRSVIRWYIRNN